ncbi:hypothetical protein PC111_g18941 [Phytophthora cactorum]|nr:hypothetical protein PC112_g19732 [Phytophthora cactorum]KAG2802818.1 hypothetical protein PC111_g18941 [Phytophthora cactorum]KAG3066196.1 hypothetical protein PC122_g17885 [Phytophthora cactorum]KAG3156137.1 hypothetical protein C6341_g15176 [Phytophthora cactorum]
MRVVNDAGADACLVVCLVQTAPKNGLTVTDPMLTGDYAGARKVALALSWSSRLSDVHPAAHQEGAPAHGNVTRRLGAYPLTGTCLTICIAALSSTSTCNRLAPCPHYLRPSSRERRRRPHRGTRSNRPSPCTSTRVRVPRVLGHIVRQRRVSVQRALVLAPYHILNLQERNI